jgi:endonuclease VIII
MPEGDSIHNLAARLSRRLLDKEVRTFEARTIEDDVAKTVVGRKIVAVDARGKNLLIRLDDGRVLHIHLRMLGRVRFERPRSTFYKPRVTRPQLRLAVEDGTAIVGARIPVLRLLKAGAEKRAPDLVRLGPDLLDPNHDEDEAVRRLLSLGKMPVGEAVLVQRAVAGIGNIYKSETLFLEKTNPTVPVVKVGEARLRKIVRRASALMRANLSERGGARVIRPSMTTGRFHVYGRKGKPCFACGTPIERIRQGAEAGRSTYYCPSCQAG